MPYLALLLKFIELASSKYFVGQVTSAISKTCIYNLTQHFIVKDKII